jgi:phosphatidate cytidylyltransferase
MWQLRKGKSKIFAFIYILFPLSIIQIFALNSEIYLNKTFDPSPILMMLVLTWTFDTFAYLIGSKLGKNKIAPKLSPKKSWEGFGGGLISTLIICYLITDFNLLTVNIDNFNNYILAIFIPFTASLGDFIESYYKRQAGVKNSGKLIPGHGGILDRIDAIMITIPFLYLYINLI